MKKTRVAPEPWHTAPWTRRGWLQDKGSVWRLVLEDSRWEEGKERLKPKANLIPSQSLAHILPSVTCFFLANTAQSRKKRWVHRRKLTRHWRKTGPWKTINRASCTRKSALTGPKNLSKVRQVSQKDKEDTGKSFWTHRKDIWYEQWNCSK